MSKIGQFLKRHFFDIINPFIIFLLSIFVYHFRNCGSTLAVLSILFPIFTWYANGIIRRFQEKKLSNAFCDCWEVELHFRQTDIADDVGLRVFFLVQLYMVHGKIKGKSTKDREFNPRFHDKHAHFKDQHRTSGKLDLVIDRDIITVHWIEKGVKRETKMTQKLQSVSNNKILSGTFTWEASNARGEAIWQRNSN